MDEHQLDSGLKPERLRHEQEQAHFNELYLLAPATFACRMRPSKATTK